MSAKVEQYRRKAEEAEQMAATVRDPASRAVCLDIASKWRELASQSEKRGAEITEHTK